MTAVWQVYLLIFAINACSAAFTPTFQATIPNVLPEEADYTQALSLSRLAYDLENLASPTLAGLALLLVSYDTLFVVNACTFLFSAFLLATLLLPAPRPTQRASGLWQNTRFGLESYLRTPRRRSSRCLTPAGC